MTLSHHGSPHRLRSTMFEWLNHPLSTPWCALGWLCATGVFIAITAITGGLTENDANVSVYAAWALAHGHLGCAYLASGVVGYAPTAPLYPLLSGAMVSILRIGHGVAFPTQAQLGLHCTTATAAMTQWALRAGAWSPTLRIGFIGWLALLVGVVALLRASGRGKCGWEPLAVLLVACTPPVAMCLVEYFHPQDLLALGLALAGLALAIRGKWPWVGALLGLALISQQFALLVFVPLLVLVPRKELLRFVGSTFLSGAVVAVPLIILTSGRAMTSVLVGTGESSGSSSLLFQTGIRGSPMYVLSRFLPIALAFVLAWWAAQRLGRAVLQPLPLVSLVATSLCLRLIFEVNVWGYYFMAVAVLLVVLDVIRGRIRIALVAWLAVLTWAAINAMVHRATHQPLPIWLWQAVLVSVAVTLAIRPLLVEIKNRTEGAMVTTPR